LLHITSSFSLKHTPTPDIYTLSLHDALPISTETSVPAPELPSSPFSKARVCKPTASLARRRWPLYRPQLPARQMVVAQSLAQRRSEEHTSELQSRGHLVCRLLLEKKKTQHHT